MLAYVLIGVMLCLIGAMVCAVWRVLAGPSLPDRVVALDLIAALLVVFLVVFRLMTGIEAYMHVAVGLALISFLGTVAFAQYIERADE